MSSFLGSSFIFDGTRKTDRRKRALREGTRFRMPLFRCLGVPQKYYTKSCNIYAEDLPQTQVDAELADSVSVNSDEI